jgi:hypothetical protein
MKYESQMFSATHTKFRRDCFRILSYNERLESQKHRQHSDLISLLVHFQIKIAGCRDIQQLTSAVGTGCEIPLTFAGQ